MPAEPLDEIDPAAEYQERWRQHVLDNQEWIAGRYRATAEAAAAATRRRPSQSATVTLSVSWEERRRRAVRAHRAATNLRRPPHRGTAPRHRGGGRVVKIRLVDDFDLFAEWCAELEQPGNYVLDWPEFRDMWRRARIRSMLADCPPEERDGLIDTVAYVLGVPVEYVRDLAPSG
jgi:hypothetical protein